MVRRGGGGRLGWAFKGAYEDRPVGSRLRTMRGNVEGIIHAHGDMPAGGLPVCGTRLALELPARMPIMAEEAAGMEMNGVSFMVRAFVNANEHPLHRPLGQEGPCQKKNYKSDNGLSFHFIFSILADQYSFTAFACQHFIGGIRRIFSIHRGDSLHSDGAGFQLSLE